MAHYASRGQLHLSDTRDQAAEQVVQTWAALTEGRDIREVALIADASNQEIDRLNAAHDTSAHNEANRTPRVPATRVHYGYAKATSSHSSHDAAAGPAPSRERHLRPVSAIHDHGMTVTLDGSRRGVHLPASTSFARLAYAQHVYRQQVRPLTLRVRTAAADQQRDRLCRGDAATPRHRLVRRTR